MKDLDKILAALHTELAEELLRRIRQGEATATDLNVVRQFLKDNGIEGNLNIKNSPIHNILDEIDFDEGIEEKYN